MSIALVVTRGYGNGTLTGTVKDVTLRGYSIGVTVEINVSSNNIIGIPNDDLFINVSQDDTKINVN